MEYFNFQFIIYNFIQFIAVIINLVLAIMILRMGIQNPANKWFAIFLFCLVVWGMSQVLARSSESPEQSVIWNQIGPPGWVFMSVAFFCFTLYFIKKQRILENFYIQLLIFLPGLLFLFLAWNTDFLVDMHTPIRQFFKPWGWDSEYGNFFWVFIVWLEFFFTVSMFLLFRHYIRLENKEKRKQTFFIMLGLFVPLVIGSATDAILPILDIMFFKTAVIFTTVMAIIVAYAIFKYKLFVVSPATAFYNIINTMTEGLLVMSFDQDLIEVANKAASKLLGYNEEELEGQPIKTIITPAYWKSFEERGLIPLQKGKEVKNLETKFLTKEGGEIPVNFSASVMKQVGQKPTGIVAVASDITQTKNLIRNLEKTAEELRISKYNLEAKLAKITEAR